MTGFVLSVLVVVALTVLYCTVLLLAIRRHRHQQPHNREEENKDAPD